MIQINSKKGVELPLTTLIVMILVVIFIIVFIIFSSSLRNYLVTLFDLFKFRR
jgi:hypothetical protein